MSTIWIKQLAAWTRAGCPGSVVKTGPATTDRGGSGLRDSFWFVADASDVQSYAGGSQAAGF
jgi:hypothetical protein